VMKSILLGASLVIAAVSAQDALAQAHDGLRLQAFRNYAQVRTGDMVIPTGSTTSGSVMVIRGNLDVYGNVDGAATAILGDVIVHEGGRVRGGAVALMGHVRNEGGSILGVIKDVGPTHNRSTVSFGARPRTTIGSLVSAIVWLVVLLLMGTFVLFFMRDYFKRAVEVVTNETGRSLFTGVVAGLATVPAVVALCIAMAITIIGIFFIPIGVVAFLVAVGGIAGGLLVSPVSAAVARGRGWIPIDRYWHTVIGAAVGFLGAAVIATHTLNSPVGPLASTLLIGAGAVLGARWR